MKISMHFVAGAIISASCELLAGFDISGSDFVFKLFSFFFFLANTCDATTVLEGGVIFQRVMLFI